MKKFLSILLAVSMLLGLFSFVLAEEQATEPAKEEQATEPAKEEKVEKQYDLKGHTVKVRLWDLPNPYDDETEEVKKAEWLPRFEEIKKKYNVNFEFYKSASEYDDMPAEWIKSVSSGSPAWHITNNLSVMWLPKLVLNNALVDISKAIENYKMPEEFKNVGKFKDGCYGYITGYPGPETLVFNRKMIMEAGMEKDPMEMFLAGKWDYENFVKYMTELQSKLPEGSYAMFMDPMYWGLFAPPANGRALAVRPDYTVGITDEKFIDAIETLEKLQAAGCLRPANKNEEGKNDYWGTPSATFDKGIEVAMTHRAVWQYGALNENKLDWGIVPYPWGKEVTVKMGQDGSLEDLENYHSMYYDTALAGAILAGVENDFKDLDKDYVIEALSALSRDLFMTEDEKAELEKMTNPDYVPEVNPNDFPSEVDAKVFAFVKEKIVFNPIATIQNAGLGKSKFEGKDVTLYQLLRLPFEKNVAVRATYEAALPEIEQSFKDAGLIK